MKYKTKTVTVNTGIGIGPGRDIEMTVIDKEALSGTAQNLIDAICRALLECDNTDDELKERLIGRVSEVVNNKCGVFTMSDQTNYEANTAQRLRDRLLGIQELPYKKVA